MTARGTNPPQIERPLHRCNACSAWWTVAWGESKKCPCGGELVLVDMEKHLASLPKAQAEKGR